ncbi:Rhodanese-like domain containing protein [Tritrichomonas foetus]|uniref:protein-tyrosine-phosphatase n=1 Tax=Tritrichomonas foetus TaxID=1144522 RepID=A0A1J4KNL6_9EUKA|nr:Rhodanese-like domain containing protein [Tritrichomonas foetus]|eukprot:OHT11388.1 Rhodanese-like domain containing protein [Tritrichomonas foetus]
MIARSSSVIIDLGIPVPDLSNCDDLCDSCSEDSFESCLTKNHSQSRFPLNCSFCNNEKIDNNGNYSNINHGFTNEDPYGSITPNDFAVLLTNPESHGYDRLLVLDARYTYEYRGGRIIGARNIISMANMVGIFQRYKNENVCIIFHCEYSHNRGPSLMRMFREYDRKVNLQNYPKLFYPNIFLLEGGYKQFYNLHPELCIGGYVPMRKPEFIQNGLLRKCHSEYFKDSFDNDRRLNKPRSRSMSPALLPSILLSEITANDENSQNSLLIKDFSGFSFSASQPL